MTRLLIGLTGGLYRFDLNAGGSQASVLPGVQPMAIAMDPSEAARVFCATYNRGLWRSEDAGETWLPVGTPQGFFERPAGGAIQPRETTFVSVDPVAQADGRHAVWVGTEPSRLYRSTDHGDTFELASALDLPSRSSWSFPPRPGTHHVQCIAHTSDGGIHLAIEAGAMIRSHDNGKTFKDRLPDSPLDTHVLLTHPLAPRRLYAALGDALLRPGRSFAESQDGGDTWVYSGKGLEESPYLYGLAIHPGNPEEIRVAASQSPQRAHMLGGASIFRREADMWVEDAEGFPRDRSLNPVLATHTNQLGVGSHSRISAYSRRDPQTKPGLVWLRPKIGVTCTQRLWPYSISNEQKLRTIASPQTWTDLYKHATGPVKHGRMLRKERTACHTAGRRFGQLRL